MSRIGTSKIGIFVLSGLSVCLVVGLTIGYWGQRRELQVTAAAGSSRGESHILIHALKSVVERHHPRVHMAVVETGGTAESLRLLDRGAVLLAAAQADVPAPPSARMVAVLYEDTFQLLVPLDSPVESFGDLRGKRIALPQSGGQYQSFLSVADHFGLAVSDFEFVGRDDASADEAFLAGKADAAFRVRALGNPSLVRLARTHNVRFVKIHQAAAMAIKLPAFHPSMVPEGAYLGNPPIPSVDLPTVGVRRTLLAHRDADPEVVRIITDVLMERRLEIARAIPDEHAEVRSLLVGIAPPPPISGLEVPVHSGALLYYDKDKPSFVQANADFVALILTIAVLLGSWIWELRRWIVARQKNRADAFNDQVVLLLTRVEATDDGDELEHIRDQLVRLLTDAVHALDEDRISEGSFQSFRVVWQITAEMTRERRDGLRTMRPASPVAR